MKKYDSFFLLFSMYLRVQNELKTKENELFLALWLQIQYLLFLFYNLIYWIVIAVSNWAYIHLRHLLLLILVLFYVWIRSLFSLDSFLIYLNISVLLLRCCRRRLIFFSIYYLLREKRRKFSSAFQLDGIELIKFYHRYRYFDDNIFFLLFS